MELTSVCIESTLDVYRNDFTCVSKRLRFVSKRLVSKRLCIETTVNQASGFCSHLPNKQLKIFEELLEEFQVLELL